MEKFEIKYEEEKHVLIKQLLDCVDVLETIQRKQNAHIAILEMIFESPDDTDLILCLLEIVIEQTQNLHKEISIIQKNISEVKTALQNQEGEE